MFKRDVQTLKDVLLRNLREQGLETPLLQKRLVDAWPHVAGPLHFEYLYLQSDALCSYVESCVAC